MHKLSGAGLAALPADRGAGGMPADGGLIRRFCLDSCRPPMDFRCCVNCLATAVSPTHGV